MRISKKGQDQSTIITGDAVLDLNALFDVIRHTACSIDQYSKISNPLFEVRPRQKVSTVQIIEESNRKKNKDFVTCTTFFSTN
jgi:hypothetical protein